MVIFQQQASSAEGTNKYQVRECYFVETVKLKRDMFGERCGPLFDDAICGGNGPVPIPFYSVFCVEPSGWCGYSGDHRHAQASTRYHFRWPGKRAPAPAQDSPSLIIHDIVQTQRNVVSVEFLDCVALYTLSKDDQKGLPIVQAPISASGWKKVDL